MIKAKHIFLLVILFAGLFYRLFFYHSAGGDFKTYEQAVSNFISGSDIYKKTVESFSEENDDDPGDHGFSTLPGYLIIQAPFYLLSQYLNVPFYELAKIPIIICDLLIAFMIFKILDGKNQFAALLGPALWLLNPHIVSRGGYTQNDPLAIAFMLLAIYFLNKKSSLAGLFLGIAISFKTFPLILLPMFFLVAKERIKFLAYFVGILFLISLPFMSSISEFVTYVQGAFLVHSGREVQGQPFLWYISYYYNLEFIQVPAVGFYTYLALVMPWIASVALYFKNKNLSVYALGTVAFSMFYLFTPVLNRTYILWFFPLFLIAMGQIFSGSRLKYILSVGVVYIFFLWYLSQWIDGFHITIPS